MFENVIHQSAVKDIANSLLQGDLPNALLFWGEKTSGKLTAALELARVLSCENRDAALKSENPLHADVQCAWDCPCASCLRHKRLASQDVLLAGSRDCLPEIEAAQKTFLEAFSASAQYVNAACFLFVRSVRKLTLRFSPSIMQNEESQKIQKIASLVSDIEQLLEDIEPPLSSRALGQNPQKITAAAVDLCKKLDSDFMYSALPVSYVRSISSWARFAVKTGKKTVIVENAETLNEHARNAFLKILEEPPEGIVFVLTTVNRQMMMPTILSRVRTCRFESREHQTQCDVLKRVFHVDEKDIPVTHNAIEEYLNSFLPVSPDSARRLGSEFLYAIISGEAPDSKKTAARVNGFYPAQLLNAFFDGMISALKNIARSDGSENENRRAVNFCAQCMGRVNEAKTRGTRSNQNPVTVLDALKNEIASLA